MNKTLKPTVTLAMLALATLLAQVSPASTITDNFTTATNWGTVLSQGGGNISVGSGRMNYTSTTTGNAGAAIPRNLPLLPTTQDWSLKVDAHLNATTLTNEGQYSDVFLGFGKTGDWFDTHVTFEFGRGWWGSHNGYYIGDDVRINGVDAPDLFNAYNLSLSASESALRMDYNAANQTITYYFDADGPTGGYNWVAQGTANLASGAYNLNLGPTDTLTIFLLGSSELQTVTAGQAYLSNLEITIGAATNLPPVIAVQPRSQTNEVGTTATLSVSAISSAPLIYQWRFNGTNLINTGNISGVTTTNLTITSIQTNNAGNYSVVVTNNYGSMTSSVVVLSVFEHEPYTYTVNNGAITITGYTGSDLAISIPQTIMGLPVTRIGYAAFDRCFSLSTVVIPNGVTTIEQYAFEACYGLTNVAIPNSVVIIGDGAFQHCTYMPSITIPNSVKVIGSYAFGGCSHLTAITVDALNSFYSSMNGVLFDKSQTKLIQYPLGMVGSGSYSIPTNVASIGVGAFLGSHSLTNITVPNSVTSIGDNAFFGCSGLTSVTIPNSVTVIGNAVFGICNQLTAINVDALNSFYSSTNGVLFNKSQTTLVQYPAGKAGSYTIPNSVISIGDYAFYYCGKLTSLYFNGNAPNLGGSYVFYLTYNATVYYLADATGWGSTFGGLPTALWKPQAQTSDASFGVQTNQFGFNINWASGQTVVVEATTNLVNWSPVSTNTLTSGASYFSDPHWTNFPGRFYRLRSP